MTTSNVKRLAYVALNTRDPEGMSRFYQENIGLTETDRDADGNIYLRCDEYHHAVVLIPNGDVGMHHYGLDVGSEAALSAAASKLESYGAQVREATPLLGQASAIEATDPAGNVVRLVGATETLDRPKDVRAVQPRKFGHVNHLSPKPITEIRDFYVEGLDARVSDWLLDQAVWMRCNPDHHGIAYGAAGRAGMQHMAFEIESLSALAHQADHLARLSQALLWGPGRHGPGNNLFIYFHDPEHNVIEFTAEVEQIWHDDNRATRWDPEAQPTWSNAWGAPPSPEFLANMDPDYQQQ